MAAKAKAADAFPVEDDAAEEPTAERKRGPAKGSDVAKAAGQKAADTRKANKAVVGLEERLTETTTKAGALIMPLFPLPGAYLADTGDKAAGYLLAIARENPRLLRQLESSSAYMDYVALGLWVAGLLVACLVQMGVVPVDSMPAATFGIDDLYRRILETVPDDDEGEEVEQPSRSARRPRTILDADS